jgi:hypothetical protein
MSMPKEIMTKIDLAAMNELTIIRFAAKSAECIQAAAKPREIY